MRLAIACAVPLFATSAFASERPAWVPHNPPLYLAEAIALGGTLSQVVMMPVNPHDRWAARAGMATIPVYYITVRGRLLRCADGPDRENETPPRIVPNLCDVAVVRTGLPWVPAGP